MSSNPYHPIHGNRDVYGAERELTKKARAARVAAAKGEPAVKRSQADELAEALLDRARENKEIRIQLQNRLMSKDPRAVLANEAMHKAAVESGDAAKKRMVKPLTSLPSTDPARLDAQAKALSAVADEMLPFIREQQAAYAKTLETEQRRGRVRRAEAAIGAAVQTVTSNVPSDAPLSSGSVSPADIEKLNRANRAVPGATAVARAQSDIIDANAGNGVRPTIAAPRAGVAQAKKAEATVAERSTQAVGGLDAGAAAAWTKYRVEVEAAARRADQEAEAEAESDSARTSAKMAEQIGEIAGAVVGAPIAALNQVQEFALERTLAQYGP